MKKRILIIEDDPTIHECYRDLLGDDFELVFSIEKSEVETLIPTVDLVISDYHFSPSFKFEEVREMVRGVKPLILVTGESRLLHGDQIHKPDIFKSLQTAIDRAFRTKAVRPEVPCERD